MCDGSWGCRHEVSSVDDLPGRVAVSQRRLVVVRESVATTGCRVAGRVPSGTTLLAHNPERWTPPAEHDVFSFEARELIYGLARRKTHRAIFEIRGDEVIVHCIRHLAQQPLTSDDL